jgi:hypothetical protein
MATDIKLKDYIMYKYKERIREKLLRLGGNICYRKADSSDNPGSVVSSLQWLLIAECLRPQMMATISVTARFCRLLTVFLAGERAF